jgi:phage tail sheath protein FI
MPEYLTPGVYLEETSFRSRSIEGVATSTFGMAGSTRYGPVPYVLPLPNRAQPVVMVPSPWLVTSQTEFERAFGDLGPVGTASDSTNYLAYAARAFFGNGGRRLYVSRVFPFSRDGDGAITTANFAALAVGGGGVVWRARWPGTAGNAISVQVGLQRSKNILSGGLKGVAPGAAVERFANRNDLPKDVVDPVTRRRVPAPPVFAEVEIVGRRDDGSLGLVNDQGGVDPVTDDGVQAFCHLTLTVSVRMGGRTDVYPGLEFDRSHPRSAVKVLQAEDPTDELSLIWLDDGNQQTITVATALLTLTNWAPLAGATDGAGLAPTDLAGSVADPDDARIAATGLAALAEVEDIAIVSSPDAVRFDSPAERKTAVDDLIAHCEAQRAYRIGIVDPPKDSSISEVRQFRSQFDSTYTALYYPWVNILDPTVKPDPGAAPVILPLPPSGYAAGIYARSDIERGVHKAPANEVVLGITGFAENVTHDRQAVLNPEGINALRFFEGRANRIWGARTMSSDPEWKYVNVRRLFNYLEHSIDRSTQWAVFEPNNERLWASIRQTIEDFLLVVWRTGALMGTKPEEAYFVRCDRSTMTQNDLDNGRLICLIGVAPTYPAEFVIFRIGQWTADAQQS